MTPPTWELALAHYSEEERETLEAAAVAQAERIEKAALDLSCTGVVDGIDIGELWFAVERRRQQLADEAVEPVEAPVAPVEEEPAQEPSNDAPEAEEAAESEAAPAAPEEAPKPKPRGRPRKTA